MEQNGVSDLVSSGVFSFAVLLGWFLVGILPEEVSFGMSVLNCFLLRSSKVSMCGLRCSKITGEAALVGSRRKECVSTGCSLGGTWSVDIE